MSSHSHKVMSQSPWQLRVTRDLKCNYGGGGAVQLTTSLYTRQIMNKGIFHWQGHDGSYLQQQSDSQKVTMIFLVNYQKDTWMKKLPFIVLSYNKREGLWKFFRPIPTLGLEYFHTIHPRHPKYSCAYSPLPEVFNDVWLVVVATELRDAAMPKAQK